MWSEGFVSIANSESEVIARYYVKHYDEPSEYGIDGGRISKLQIKVGNKTIVNYDRGWDIKPKTEEEDVATSVLLAKFN